MKIFKEKVFSYMGRGGNIAGVVLDNGKLDENRKNEIAKELNYSETAFIKIDGEEIKIEFYTPKCKIDFCGHACIGSFISLLKNGYIDRGVYKVNLDIGVLEVLVEENRVYLEQDTIKIFPVDEENKILESIGIKKEELLNNFEIVIGYSGLKDILIPIDTRERLNSLDINFDLVEKVSEEKGVVGYHVYTKDKGEIYCRNFAPLYGIKEESATGSSNGALLGYLLKKGTLQEGEYKIFQGENYGDISLIYGKILKNKKIYIGSEF